jgi:hypothetical protein
VYLAAMVVLIATMRDGATAARVQKLSNLFGVSRRTVARWRQWWLSSFAAGPFWQAERAAFMPPVDTQRLPASLVERFAGGIQEQLIALLRFLGFHQELLGLVQIGRVRIKGLVRVGEGVQQAIAIGSLCAARSRSGTR